MNKDRDKLAERLRAGDRRSLARAITLVESSREDHMEEARRLLKRIMPHTGRSVRIGISGVPGVGKSTFIEAFGNFLIDRGKRVAVLAVDPSSSISGGSILGDKTRMESLARNESAFIRPSPAGTTLGGVARRTRESILVCEAAGFDAVIVETVGVGQSETLVARMTDVFVLLMLPGGGDELQGIKRGILELADLVVINKADGEWRDAATRAAADYQNALQYVPSRFSQWRVPVLSCSALENEGIIEVWKQISAYLALLEDHGELQDRRSRQAGDWMWREVADLMLENVKGDPDVQALVAGLEQQVARQELPASTAAREIIERFLANRKQRMNEAPGGGEK